MVDSNSYYNYSDDWWGNNRPNNKEKKMSWFNITLPWGNNGKFVKTTECHRLQDNIVKKIDDLDKHICDRIDDIKDIIQASK